MFAGSIAVRRTPADRPGDAHAPKNIEHSAPPGRRDQVDHHGRSYGGSESRAGMLEALPKCPALQRQPRNQGAGTGREGGRFAGSKQQAGRGQRDRVKR